MRAIKLGDELAELHSLLSQGDVSAAPQAAGLAQLMTSNATENAARLGCALPSDELTSSFDPKATEIARCVEARKGAVVRSFFQFSYHAMSGSLLARETSRSAGEISDALTGFLLRVHVGLAIEASRGAGLPNDLLDPGTAVQRRIHGMESAPAVANAQVFREISKALSDWHAAVSARVLLVSVM